jgi:hypothetical protein
VLTIIAIIAAVVASVAIGVQLYHWVTPATHPQPFQRIRMTRLTTTGNATIAAISPDGRYVVHAVSDNGKESLWVRQVATSSNIQIAPPRRCQLSGLDLFA